MYNELKNIIVLDKNFNKIGILTNQGANPQAPYYDDLYIQELDTGADIYQFSAPSTSYTRSILVIGNHITFEFNNRQEMFTISSIELEHRNGYNTIGVYAEGIGFELLEVYIRKPKKDDSSSSGGNDSDNDGDDNFDDEYGDPDNVMIDEDGNIIYIPDKEASNYANPDNVIIDEDGNISYQPNKDKNNYNKNKDSELKFKLSYPDFLKLVLKKTDWSYECQPGLENNIVETSIKYDTNIYALLQESMQSYKGVELEFVYEYYGNPKKVVRAYNHGGRGSFIGKRFEYGSNVAGIVKNEEIINVEDDTILFVDGFEDIGIEVNYEVDFALKSLDITDMNIGDTHYVLDKDFNPAQFKARIGKIEISFSDRTQNKIYLANSKKIKGNTPEEFENLDPIIDDPIIDDPGYDEPGDPIVMTDALFKAPRMHSYEFLLYTNRTFGNYSVSERMNDYTNITDGMSIREDVPKTEELYNFIVNEAKVYDCSPIALDNIRGVINSNYCLRLFPQNYCKNENCSSMSLAASRVFSTMINRETDLPDFHPISKNDHYDEHILDVGSLTCALVSAIQHHIKKDHGGDGGDFENLKVSKWITVGTETSPQGDAVGIKLLCNGRETKITPGGITAMDIDANSIDSKQMTVSDTLDAKRIRVYGDGLHIFSSITFADGSVLTSAKGLNSGGNSGGDDGGSDSGGSSTFDTIKANFIEANNAKFKTITFPDGTVLSSASSTGASVAYITDVSIDSNNHLIITFNDNSTIDAGQLPSAGSDVGGDLGIPDGVIVYSTEEDESGEFDPPFLCLNNANVKVEQSLIVGGMVYAQSIWTDDFYTDTVKCDKITQGTSTAPLEFDCDVIFKGNVSGINGSGGTDLGLYLEASNTQVPGGNAKFLMVPHDIMPPSARPILHCP